MKKHCHSFRRQALSLLSALLLIFAFYPQLPASAGSGDRNITILFTHDIHSHLEGKETEKDGEKTVRGGAARLAALLRAEREESGEENCLYVDSGDFSQGTLFQAGYLSDANELRLLGELGCDYVTIGNHEWDLAGEGLAEMLRTALKKAEENGETLPGVVIGNLDFTGELTEEQKKVRASLEEYGDATGCPYTYTIREMENGIKVGIFGLSGLNSIEDSPTAGMKWTNYIEAAKVITAELEKSCDLILCLSHSGMSGRESGEDCELAKECPGIDVIVSGHSHSSFDTPVVVGTTRIVSAGEYMENLGVLSLTVKEDGSISELGYHLDALDETVEEDPSILSRIGEIRERIGEEYIDIYRDMFTELDEVEYDGVIAHCGFDFISLSEMYATHDEYPLGDLIADSYLYEARKQGIDDIDVCLVGLGTIRNSISAGDITLADAFEICSLGVGSDRSAGHPLLTGYVTGAELKLLLQLDSSLGPSVSSIKMSYAGLRYSFNTERVLLDRVTEAYLVSEDGTEEEIDEERRYKFCCNLYAANMLGMLNSLTKGVLKITPTDREGNVISDFSAVSLKTADGREIKEWVAFADYLSSFDKNDDGISEIPGSYSRKDGRKYKYSEGGAARLRNPGTTTVVLMIAVTIAFAGAILVLGKVYRKVSTSRRKRHRDRGKEDSTEVLQELEGQEKRHRDQHR